MPESIFWLLMTGEVPSQAEIKQLSEDWLQRAESNPLPDHIKSNLKSLPKTLHPMSQFSMGILMLQERSKFYKQYQSGSLHKNDFWEPTFEDINDIVASIPSLVAEIYRNVTGKAGSTVSSKDWAGRFAQLLGYTDPKFLDLLRLYMSIHSDHEGGNVSAHAVHLVGSSLSDPYLAFSAGLNGLAGPLHGLANQEVLQWILELTQTIGTSPSDTQVEQYLWDSLKRGQVIPGFGHAVLRKTDPRYTCQREFAQKHFPEDPLVKLANQLYNIVPQVLTKHGKVKNPWPNVDAHSGVLLYHYGFKEQDFYTVLFGASRALGALSGMLWDRVLGFPIERPKSMTSEAILKLVGKQKLQA